MLYCTVSKREIKSTTECDGCLEQDGHPCKWITDIADKVQQEYRKTIFPDIVLFRGLYKLEDFLLELTPVQKVGDMYFKREDYFAPMGYSGVNGSKLRQLIWLIHRFTFGNPGAKAVVSGAVSGSPQHLMAAIVAKHYGLEYYGFIGGKSIEGKKTLQLAEDYGAKFIFSPVGYAKTLDSMAHVYAGDRRGFFHLETNIVVNAKSNPVERVRSFHFVGAAQVQNIPDEVDTLIIPCGSATSTISILNGLYLYEKKNLKRVVLMGIGNIGSNNIDFIFKRLKWMGAEHFTKDLEIVHLNLNGTGYCKYEDLRPAEYHGIEFHPRYEGKCINYLQERAPEFINDKSLFWIVGSEPKF